MSVVRRGRQTQCGTTNRKQAIGNGSLAISESIGSMMTKSRSTPSLRRANSAILARKKNMGRSTAHLKPLEFPITPGLRKKRKNTLLVEAETDEYSREENPALEALVNSISTNLQQRYTGKRSLRKVFLAWDVNRDGVVDPWELEAIFRKCGCNVSTSEAQQICRYYGEGKDYIPYGRFLDLIFKEDEPNGETLQTRTVDDLKERLRQVGVGEEEIAKAAANRGNWLPVSEIIKRLKIKFQAKRSLQKEFRAIDDDKNGKVSIEEFHNFLSRMGLETSREELQKLFSRFDKSLDGEVDYSEFTRIVFPSKDIGSFDQPVAESDSESEEEEEEQSWAHDASSKTTSLAPRAAVDAVSNVNTGDIDDSTAGGVRDALITARVRKNIAQRITNEFVSIVAAFKAIDSNSDGLISYGEFKGAVRKLGLPLSGSDVDLFLRYMDKDGSGHVDFEEFQNFVDIDNVGSAKTLAFAASSTSSAGRSRRLVTSASSNALLESSNNQEHNSQAIDNAWAAPSKSERKISFPSGDHVITTRKTATVSNIGLAHSNRAPIHIEKNLNRIKRKLYPQKRAASANNANIAPIPTDQKVTTSDRKVRFSDNVSTGSSTNGRSTAPASSSRTKFSFDELSKKFDVPRLDRNRPVHDTTNLIRPTPQCTGVEGTYTYSGGETGRFRPETRMSYSGSERSAYHNQPEQIKTRERRQMRLENYRQAQDRYKKDNVPVFQDPDRRLKTVLKHRLNYYCRLNELLERDQKKKG